MIFRGKQLTVRLKDKDFHCALDVTMAFVGGKWKAVLLWYLRPGPQRFSALKRQMPEITEKMLSLQLKALEKDGLVLRKVYAEVPPRVEYKLSPEGRSLEAILKAMAAWGRRKSLRDGQFTLDGKVYHKGSRARPRR
ncbi:MAG TPA: helix-turn-helix domain-containing protein [bacterium]|jgi:DNA-binding HxlR family transcriptional regulator|nr:helix-turn-helix domain-containing protein [bacterium]